MDERDPAIDVRSVLDINISVLDSGNAHHQDLFSSVLKWTYASLLTLNSGALLAVLNFSSGRAGSNLLAATMFFLGIMASLNLAFRAMKNSAEIDRSLSNASTRLKILRSSNFSDEEIHEMQNQVLENVEPSPHLRPIHLSVPIIMFTLGVISTVYSVYNQDMLAINHEVGQVVSNFADPSNQ